MTAFPLSGGGMSGEKQAATGPTGRHRAVEQFDEIDTSRNPYTRSRPLMALLRQPLNIVGALIAIFWIFRASDAYVFMVSSGLVIGIVVLGIMVMTGWCREVNLASAGVYATTLYLASYVYRTPQNGPGWSKPIILAVVVAIGIGAMIMLAVAPLAVRFSGVYVMVFTLGLQEMIEQVMFTRYHLTGGDTALSNPPPVIFGYDLEGHDRAFYLFLLVIVGLVLAFLSRLRFSPYGRAMMLAGADQQAAAAVGVNPWRIKALGFAVCGGLGGLGGILAAMLFVSAPTSVNYQATTSLLWLGIAMLGGFDTMTAVLGASILFQVVPFRLEHYHLDYQALAGSFLLVGILMGRRGLGGRLQDLYRRVRFGTAATRRAARRPTSTASVLSRSDGISEISEYGANAAIRKHALAILEEWFPPRRTGELALSAYDIHLAFGGVKALRGANLEVPIGSFTGLIGPNGAGKTTLFDVVSGLQTADRGTVRIFGQNVTGMKPWDRAALGMTRTFQTTRAVNDLPVSDNLLAGAGLRIPGNFPQFIAGDPRPWRQVREAEEAAWAIAQLLNIDRYWDERVGELEFSARRRCELGRALLSGPQILLLDEPTSGLDPASSGALISLVRQLQADLGLTVLLVEHYVKAVLEGCDLVYVLAEGQILAHGEPGTVAANAEVQEHYLGAGSQHSTSPWRERRSASVDLPEEQRTPARV